MVVLLHKIDIENKCCLILALANLINEGGYSWCCQIVGIDEAQL